MYGHPEMMRINNQQWSLQQWWYQNGRLITSGKLIQVTSSREEIGKYLPNLFFIFHFH